tara:strand:+ start:8675 stop:9046 length:372 start_codon:yes stop_codon:yes gene_type:complete
MQKNILLFILYFLPLYDCYLNNLYYTNYLNNNNKNKINILTLKSSFNNNKSSNNKKLYDDYSKFLNPKKKIKYIDLNMFNVNNTNNIENYLNDNNDINDINDNIVILYNSNTILQNIKDILKY